MARQCGTQFWQWSCTKIQRNDVSSSSETTSQLICRILSLWCIHSCNSWCITKGLSDSSSVITTEEAQATPTRIHIKNSYQGLKVSDTSEAEAEEATIEANREEHPETWEETWEVEEEDEEGMLGSMVAPHYQAHQLRLSIIHSLLLSQLHFLRPLCSQQ